MKRGSSSPPSTVATVLRKRRQGTLHTCNPTRFLVYYPPGRSSFCCSQLVFYQKQRGRPLLFGRTGRRSGSDSAACAATAEKPATTRFCRAGFSPSERKLARKAWTGRKRKAAKSMSARFFSRELPTYPPAIQRAPAPKRLPLRRPASKKWDKGGNMRRGPG